MNDNHSFLQSVEKKHQSALKAANNIKIHRYLQKTGEFSRKDHDEIQEVISALEFVIVDLWRYSFDVSHMDEKKAFHKACNDCFGLLQVMPLPTHTTEKIKHVLKMFAYSYLGEKWEDMKRFLAENRDVWDLGRGSTNWNQRVFSDIYLAILDLISKKNADGLKRAASYVKNLRAEQKKYEGEFLNTTPDGYKRSAALELAAYYHLAAAVDILASYMLDGSSASNVRGRIDYHLKTAMDYSGNAGIMDLDILLRMLQLAFAKMVENSIWNVTGQINFRATKFVQQITRHRRPVYELLYPQRTAILEQRLLDPALRSIVVNMPTSSGKTMIAEFRILQAVNQFHDTNGKIIYVVPTRTLVNQITNKLRQDLGSTQLEIQVEKMSGALEIDFVDKNVLQSDSFDVLVTTPEKLSLLIRNPESQLAQNIVLVIIDEAHNISNKSRGLHLEMLISTIQNDCQRSSLLLMTPFVPNHEEVARWLDPYNPQSISMGLDWWQPNDRVVGLCYATGKKNRLTTHFKPLVTHSPTMSMDKTVQLGSLSDANFSISDVRQVRSNLAVLVASQLSDTGNVLILGQKISDTWGIAKKLSDVLPNMPNDLDRDLVSRYVEAELGESFPLSGYIKKGIGVHNAGLPDDIRELMEWLMEEGRLKVLVATTTISQGVNFPVNAIILATYKYPKTGSMPAVDFWNLVGRAGRMDQRSVGLVGIAVDRVDSDYALEATEYVGRQTEKLASALTRMIEDAARLGTKLDLSAHASEPEWSSFLQYISHMYRQADDIRSFIANVNISLERTYGFSQISEQNKRKLIRAVEDYARQLDVRKELADISDITGFAPETIEKAMLAVERLNLAPGDWKSSSMFSEISETLSRLAEIMLKDIPETKSQLTDIEIGKSGVTSEMLGSIINDWVSGMSLAEIAEKHFGGTDEDSIGRCARAIYSRITNAATWGIAAIQKLPVSGISESGVTERQLSSLPSMIFYGVDSEEAVLMRTNGIPRSISKNMGNLYKNTVSEYQKSSPSEVRDWIKSLDNAQWDSIVPARKLLSGNEYRQVWQKLAGI